MVSATALALSVPDRATRILWVDTVRGANLPEFASTLSSAPPALVNHASPALGGGGLGTPAL
jgi:hypothetical protein